jgi:hypothetical protein
MIVADPHQKNAPNR